jgi:REP element-mobilizing transposase RayT
MATPPRRGYAGLFHSGLKSAQTMNVLRPARLRQCPDIRPISDSAGRRAISFAKVRAGTMFTCHRHLSTCALRFVSGHVFRRAVTVGQKETGFSPCIWSFRCAVPILPTSLPGFAFFVPSSIAGKRNLLRSHRSAQLFIDVLYQYRSQRKYLLHDFVVLPDHFHLLITVRQEISIERAVQVLKADLHFAQEGNWDSDRPSGNEAFQKCGFMVKRPSLVFDNISQ